MCIRDSVRRGDYKGSMFDLGLRNYYKKAYQQMCLQKPNAVFVIFSDDIKWCKKNLSYISNSVFMENYSYQETLFLMSKCHNGGILSNSTFGLLGAYLAKQNYAQDILFYVPNKWCKLNRGVEKTIYPFWCNKIQYKEEGVFQKIFNL